ncbi:MAG TPA: carboxypeptidase-like regulatory domain-containing protein, partial [Planctomycetota bacterium]|nr:carboxypeptidase-like regulatory domain-containing protein [Planctomycetota bacterium]
MTPRSGRFAIVLATLAAAVAVAVLLGRSPEVAARRADAPIPTDAAQAAVPDAAASIAAEVREAARAPSATTGSFAIDPLLVDRTGIAGRIVDADTGAPIERSEIAVVPSSPSGGAWRALDLLLQSMFRPTDSGAFHLGGLGPGFYEVTARAEGYATSTGMPVVVRGGETTADVVVRLDRAATIRGTVVDAATGLAVAGAEIALSERRAPRDSAVSDGAGAF